MNDYIKNFIEKHGGKVAEEPHQVDKMERVREMIEISKAAGTTKRRVVGITTMHYSAMLQHHHDDIKKCIEVSEFLTEIYYLISEIFQED